MSAGDVTGNPYVFVRQRLPHAANAPSAAREVVDAVLADRVSADRLDELRLLVSELVTNAVRHGLARRGAVDFLVTVASGVARVEVIDGGSGFDAPENPPEPAEPGGWGLVVVDRLASRWGIDGGRTTRVWAELPLDTFGTNGGGSVAPIHARNV